MAERGLLGNRDPQTYAVIGAAMEVHRILGHGFLESVYRNALAVEFEERGIPFRSEVAFPVQYKGKELGLGYRTDLVCFEELIVEVKALPATGPAHKAQVLNYLKASHLKKALLLNFGGPSLEHERLVLSSPSA